MDVPEITIRPAPPYHEGGVFFPRTDVLIIFRGQHYGARYNYHIPQTPAWHLRLRQEFLRRQNS